MSLLGAVAEPVALASAAAQAPAQRRQLHGLNLIRGLAALAVLIYHSDFMFGLRGQLFPSGYLAVDLFFVLSGFVIAYTYERPVAQRRMGFGPMALRRLARLYPLYLLTTFVGLFVMTARFHGQTGYFDTGRLVYSAISNLLLLPTFLPPYDKNALFPFNAASWSIFYELAINAVFFFVLARMTTRVLAITWIAAALLLTYVSLMWVGLDVGWGVPNFLAGFPRVACSFITGMLIWRRYQASPWHTQPWMLYALLAMFLLILQDWSGGLLIDRRWSDVVVVTGFVPLLVVAGVGTSFGGWEIRIAEFLGETSYAVYLTQDSLIIAAAGFTQYVLKEKIYNLSPRPGFVFVPFCLLVSYMCYRFFERPSRDYLKGLIRR